MAGSGSGSGKEVGGSGLSGEGGWKVDVSGIDEQETSGSVLEEESDIVDDIL